MNFVMTARAKSDNVAPLVASILLAWDKAVRMGREFVIAAKLTGRLPNNAADRPRDSGLAMITGVLRLVGIPAKSFYQSPSLWAALKATLLDVQSKTQLLHMTSPAALLRGRFAAIHAWVHPMLALCRPTGATQASH